MKQSIGMNKNTLIISFQLGFPNGRATVSRVKNIALGLKQNGLNCKVISMVPSEDPNSIANTDLSGISAEGVEFLYTSSTTVKSPNRFKRYYDSWCGIISCLLYLYREKKVSNIESVILYFRKTHPLIIVTWYLRFLKIKTAVELCEWLSSFPSKTRYHKFIRDVFSKNIFRWADGAILISEFLMSKFEEFQRTSKRRRKAILLPILVDFERYPFASTHEHNYTFLFCGQLDYLQITLFVLQAFALTLKSEPRAKLYMVGNADSSANLQKLKHLSEELSLGDAVIFTGFVTNEELLNLYEKAEVLLLPLPDDTRTIARFPTKIGEYLSIGKPIVISKQGDIRNYLEDEITCYFVDKFNPELFAKRMIDSVQDFEKSRGIGIRGRQIAEKYFNPLSQGARLRNFLESL